MHIIGLDFGNSFSFPCYISDFDNSGNRLGGRPVDLIPADRNYGFPSVFFYSKKAADRARERGTNPPPWFGHEATSGKASPSKNRISKLKNNIGKPLVLDDWDKGYDEAIVLLIQHLVRKANETLVRETTETSNQISLAYPVIFTISQCHRLKELAERATLEDGRHVEVVGMIAEPAAAALDYLAENGMADRERTVLTYDLGGGTFDLAIVSVFPQGRQRADGSLYYYDIEKNGGLKIGGTDFDDVICQILKSQIPAGQTINPEVLHDLSLKVKHELTESSISENYTTSNTGEELEFSVTREQFETKAAPLVRQTIEETQKIINNTLTAKPECIILTGGASQMPMIRETLERELSAYAGKIYMYRPSRAVSYGAARYGTPLGEMVVGRVPHDIGIGYYYEGNSEKLQITTLIPAGTQMPFESEYHLSYTREDNWTCSHFGVYEAKVDNPDPLNPSRDYTLIMETYLHYSPVPKDTPHESKLMVNKFRLLKLESRMVDDPSNLVTVECQLAIPD